MTCLLYLPVPATYRPSHATCSPYAHVYEILFDGVGQRFPWRRRSIEDILGDYLVRSDGRADLREPSSCATVCTILALYFGAGWCPHCRDFKLVLETRYSELKLRHNRRFEVVYLSNDRDAPSFDKYFGKMPWYALPTLRRARPEARAVGAQIDRFPTVVLLRRDPTQDGAPFTLIPGGRDGLQLLRQPVPQVVAAFPWGGERLVLQLDKDLSELERNVSLVLLCEHLLPASPACRELLAALERVASAWAQRSEVTERRWPALKFFVARGPPSEPTRWLRGEARLPPATGGGSNLEVLLLDHTLVQPLCYSMRDEDQINHPNTTL